MTVVRTCLMVVFLACVSALFFDVRSWALWALTLAVTVGLLIAYGGWVIFTRDFWFGTPEEDAACAALDQELDAADAKYREVRHA